MTKYLVVSKKETPTCKLKIGDVILYQVEKFEYLGSMISENGKCDTEIPQKIEMAKEALPSPITFQIEEGTEG